MKTSNQSRNFTKQVQTDLLALSNDDLLITIHRWMGGESLVASVLGVAEDTCLALGYTNVSTESGTNTYWRAPSSEQLRSLLTAMDINQFAQYVIPVAFQSLHTIYPEWYEGVTFNAHLANYLRRLRASSGKSTQNA
ncbi:hypothetical protein [Dictyobacter formicarum]|uniref:Uncharacterized protein n=1 Tax=Dictyobacter formicarum TaxID=2778368 RepID=A0ABQ3VAX8_9CHLR|nr:hypothetical protein [Dictyobacter formicarum]GHO82914.1 hypothetical protein KSZ_09200 [Dictyobacter formicarum]